MPEPVQKDGLPMSKRTNGTGPPDSNLPSVREAETNKTELTPEEQMALYEKELKENDWGHQPC